FEFALCSLMVEEGSTRVAKQRCKLRPGIRRTHIDYADGLDARARRLGIDQVGHLTRLDTATEFLFGRYQDTKVQRVYRDGDLHPLAAASDDRQARRP